MADAILVITDAGRAEAVTAAGNGLSVEISEIGIGDGQWLPTPSATALQSELKRISANGAEKSTPYSVTLNFIDDSADTYQAYEVGFYLDSGTLFAVYASDTDLIAEKTAPLKLVWGKTLILSTLPADSVTVTPSPILMPPTAGEGVEGILEVATEVETQDGVRDDAAVTPAKLSALISSMMVGAVQAFIRYSAPPGWVAAMGGTIGSAASGATERANADVFQLYELIWDETLEFDLPIYDSAGNASTKGASAAADFAANKRVTLPDLRGEFVRGWDFGRGVDDMRRLGSWQDHQLEDHRHSYSSYSENNDTGGGSNNRPNNPSNRTTGNPNSGNHGDETRPRNVAFLYCIKY